MGQFVIMSLLQNTSCPAQPCFTFTQFRDAFFVSNAGFNETSPSGNTSLVILPGNHTWPSDSLFLDFIKVGESSASLSLSGYSQTEPAVIICNNVNINGLYFSAFQSVVLSDLRFEKCVMLAWQNEFVAMDNVVFNTAPLDVRYVAAVRMTNSVIILGSEIDCTRVELSGIFYSNNSHVSFRNVTHTVSSSNLDCDNPKLLVVNGSDLEIADCAFSGEAVQIVLSSTTLNVSGATQFVNGNNAILAVDSTVNLSDDVRFINNTGDQGGAIYISKSRLTVADNATVVFQGNHANYVGGAIFSLGHDISDYVSIAQTVGQPTLESCELSFGANSRIEFINNTAESGGSAMYGITASQLICNYVDFTYSGTYESLSDILSIEPDDFSAVSSDPLRVCICPDESTPDCLAILPDQNIPHLHYTVYPGEDFTIPAAVVGLNFALTSGSVYAQFLHSDSSLGSESQYVQEIDPTGCSQLQYSVLSDKTNETLVLTATRRHVTGSPSNAMRDIRVLNENVGYVLFGILPYNYFPNPPKYYSENDTFATNLTDGVFRLAGYVPRPLQDIAVFISLTLIDCPLGFTLSPQSNKCDCNERILEHDLTCDITNQTVHRDGTTWINASFSGNSSNGVIVHQHCFAYCKKEPVDVDLTNPDTQCVFNHSGTLCGACKPNFSLALGTRSLYCLPNCSNSYLLLLIPFALAGFALVFFIRILNLTVSQGTINGLIFYANIVGNIRAILFPAQYGKFLTFLSVFISWLNLDLGIETCFIKGLNGYWKTWLQFVFPFYVWAIAGAIIIASHYSSRATKIFGNNPLSVLATLFFVSYGKLLQTIFNIFSYTTLVHPDSTTSAVWAFDGNIGYLSPKHIPLFLFALAAVLLLWLPYTAVLLSAQWLRTQTHRKGLRWLKPFLDAYYGAFKDKHHYWVGVLLVVRGVLYVFFASFLAVENNVNLLLIVVCSLSLVMFLSITGGQYKKIYLSVLENSFFLNLGVLAAGTLYIRLVGGSQEALVTTSVGIAFLQFVGIVILHCYYFVIVPLVKKSKSFQFRSRSATKSRSALTATLVLETTDVASSDILSMCGRLQTGSPGSGPQDEPSLASGELTFATSSSSEAFESDSETAGDLRKSEAGAVSVGISPPPPPPPSSVGSYEPPRYCAAAKSDIESSLDTDFTSLREPLLEYSSCL